MFSSVSEAIACVGMSCSTNPFGWNSKMPGPSYGLPASACKRGSDLARKKSSPCHPSRCYAKRNRYTWTNMIVAREKRLASLTNPRWVDAFVWLLDRFHPTETHFRWHDSGDLQGRWHLDNIVEVARRVPHTKFWLPTHEPWMVVSYLQDHGAFPENLCVRLSADEIGGKPEWSALTAILAGKVATSTIHRENQQPIAVSDSRKDSVECRAHDRGNQCGPCRACWTLKVKNVSYPLTSGSRGAHGRRSDQLRIIL